jgi:hypothetical protein
MALGGTVPTAQVDGIAIFYICFSILWTLILGAGMAFLYVRRDMPILRIRGLPLSFGAVILLHMYWLAVQIGYVYGPIFPPAAEYWIMSIWFPFGVALFHASNSRFLYVARAQKRYVAINKHASDCASLRRPDRRGIMGWFKALDHTNRMLALVSGGMIFQLFLAIFMFTVSRKFHSSFGIPGTEVHGTPAEQKQAMGRGWEWWPSVFWQFFWAWIVAPVILWKSRGLNDTQGWRLQTIACCLSNLHATPMWLVALYVPDMASVNKYWIPPQWLAVSIMLLEIFTVFIPCWEVCKHNTLTQETLDSIARWESRQKCTKTSGKSITSASTASSWLPRANRASSVQTSSNGSILTMDALEHTLSKNPEPLQEFSALKDFSGENIAFLTRVREWRTTHFPTVKDSEKALLGATPVTREGFEAAVRIYSDFISSHYAEFQINLSSADFKKLESVFETPARFMYGDRQRYDPATPFEDASPSQISDKSKCSHGLETVVTCEECSTSDVSTSFWAPYEGVLPEGYDESIFDDAEMSIKYLVLTNTWPKFIKERRSFDCLSSIENGR